MILAFLLSTFILLISSLVQSAILSNMTFLPAVPDLCLICVLYFSLHNGKLFGEVNGFLSGVFLDFLSAIRFSDRFFSLISLIEVLSEISFVIIKLYNKKDLL